MYSVPMATITALNCHLYKKQDKLTSLNAKADKCHSEKKLIIKMVNL